MGAPHVNFLKNCTALSIYISFSARVRPACFLFKSRVVESGQTVCRKRTGVERGERGGGAYAEHKFEKWHVPSLIRAKAKF